MGDDDICMNCGADLDEDEDDICDTCRAVEAGELDECEVCQEPIAKGRRFCIGHAP